ncbi:MAG: hypothetical protein US49_C0006G0188 [candidate division TM6 bacterium GW2011_GWF2_37_49]|nr:MAG: hypothetical protein US49_C0006G0188 [candidate division TM6 bacterium GW2011_GWF2_37_49]
MITSIFHPNALIWVYQFLYTVCFIPQFVTNYKLKTGKGLSDLFLLAYLNMSEALLFYAFCVGLPPAYQFFYPIQTVSVLILILQRLWYDKMADSKWYWLMYTINLAAPIVLIPYAVGHCSLVGNITGWTFFIISFVCQLPLVIKIASSKSVRGISFLFLLITGIAGIMELYVALVMWLPIQTILGALRVVIFFVIFCIQFLLYNNKSNA